MINYFQLKRKSNIDYFIHKLLGRIEGYIRLDRINKKDCNTILSKEQLNKNKNGFKGISINNLGVQETLKREFCYAIAYFPAFFKKYRFALDEPSVLFTRDGNIIGEDVYSNKKLRSLKTKTNSIFIGSNFVFYKDKMHNTKGETRILIPCKRFLPLEGLSFIKDLTSGSPSPTTDKFLKNKMNLNVCDPKLGTTIVGFNLADCDSY